MKRFGKLLIAVICTAIALLNLMAVSSRFFEFRESLGLFPCAVLKIESGSMEPILSVGDLIFVWETPYENLKAGDIITFHQGNGFTTHELQRWEGSRLITKGAANNTEDDSIGPEDYCARMVFTIPYGGILLDVLTSPVSLAVCMILAAVLFYGLPLFQTLLYKGKKAAAEWRPGFLRVAASMAAISFLLVTPFLTAAKYTAKINKMLNAVAGASYFTSNFVSEEGTNYYIQGWNGRSYTINLAIRDYDNDLLYNKTGNDLIYEIRVVKVNDITYSNEYDIHVIEPSGIQTSAKEFNVPDEWPTGTTEGYAPGMPGDHDYGPYVLPGSNAGTMSHNFQVQIDSHTEEVNGVQEYSLHPGDKIKFEIYVGTDSQDGFCHELKGSFTLEAAEASDFLSEQSGNTAVGTSLVTYSLKTSQVGGDSIRQVQVFWNNELLYINEYEATIQALKSNYPANLVLDNGSGYGYVILPLQAYMSLSLQFFKFNAQDEVIFTDYEVDDQPHNPDIYAVEMSVS